VKTRFLCGTDLRNSKRDSLKRFAVLVAEMQSLDDISLGIILRLEMTSFKHTRRHFTAILNHPPFLNYYNYIILF
jgi:hypothetical protein